MAAWLDTEYGDFGRPKRVIHEEVPFLASRTVVGHIIKLNDQERPHVGGLAQKEVDMTLRNAVEEADVLVRTGDGKDVCEPNLGANCFARAKR